MQLAMLGRAVSCKRKLYSTSNEQLIEQQYAYGAHMENSFKWQYSV